MCEIAIFIRYTLGMDFVNTFEHYLYILHPYLAFTEIRIVKQTQEKNSRLHINLRNGNNYCQRIRNCTWTKVYACQ